MEVPESEAFVLHERRITNFADMARNLNPLSHDDFLNHRNNVITWVQHSGKDYFLAEKLKKEKHKDKFVELLALRNKKEEAKHVKEKVHNHDHEIKKVERKLKDLEDELPKPTNIEGEISKLHFEFEFDDFIKIIDEASHALERKDYAHAVKYYEQLKNKFEISKLSNKEKKELHTRIKELYNQIAESVKE